MRRHPLPAGGNYKQTDSRRSSQPLHLEMHLMDLNLVEHLHLDLNRFQYLEQSGWTQVCRWLRISVKNLLGQLLSLFAGICCALMCALRLPKMAKRCGAKCAKASMSKYGTLDALPDIRRY